MTTEVFNPWEFGSGLREEYEFTIGMAYFGTDASYGNGEITLLILQGVDENEEEVREMFSCGDKWETLDGGKTLSYPDKPNRHLNRNSMYAKFCGFAMEACAKADSNYLDGKSPFSADTWIDTCWHMKEKQATDAFKGRDGKMVEARTRLMPDEFLGVVEEEAPQPAKKAAPVKKAAPAKAPALSAAEKLAAARAAHAAPTENAELVALAQSSASFDEFIDAALALEDVINDDQLATQVVDNTDTGFYARYHG